MIVGSSLQDRADQLLQLAVTLGIGVPIAVLLLSLAGWWLAGAALAPVERMRSEAAAISSTDLRGRLSLPPVDDEITRLGATMNDLLDRIQASVEAERRFIDDASHELRTPLAILKAELDLALARERSPDELRRGAAERRGRDRSPRPARRGPPRPRSSPRRPPPGARHADGPPRAARGHRGPASTASDRGRGRDRRATLHPAPCASDQVRLRQAIDDLLDNALRYTPRGGAVTVAGSVDGGTIRLTVTDSGPGFSADVLSRAFEPFVADPDAEREGRDGSGLGLAIVRVIADAHGGSVQAENLPGGGARVTMTIAELT